MEQSFRDIEKEAYNQFLKHLGLSDARRLVVYESIHPFTEFHRMIDRSLCWDGTPEGYDFWYKAAIEYGFKYFQFYLRFSDNLEMLRDIKIYCYSLTHNYKSHLPFVAPYRTLYKKLAAWYELRLHNAAKSS